MFYKLPDESRFEITSITEKKFCKVIGDGQKTFGELIENNPRIKHHIDVLSDRFVSSWNHIIPKGECRLIEPIGSHDLGIEFRDARLRISPELTILLKQWSDQLPGFITVGLILSLKAGKPYKKEKILRSLKSMELILNRLTPTSLLIVF